MNSISACCDSCDALLNEREIAHGSVCLAIWGQTLCFDCIDGYEAANDASRTPAGGVA